VLSLDRPFTYELSDELRAGVGSSVRVRFHGKLTRAWVTGPADEIPSRMLPVMRLVSPVRSFDGPMLRLARWVQERYVAPLATVLGAIAPPRVASEEDAIGDTVPPPEVDRTSVDRLRAQVDGRLASYRGGREGLDAIGRGNAAFLLRPAPEDEQDLAVEAVHACLAAGRRAIVLVPEATPMPATATAIMDAFGDRVCRFLGGDRRARYRAWLDIQAGRYDVVVGTRPAVFAPLDGLGLLYVSRESHAAHREDRAPYYHVRDVALRRARLVGAACVLAASCPTGEASALGLPMVTPGRRAWPVVEVVRPGPEGRAPRVVHGLPTARRTFLSAPVPGYGVAQVCRACGSPAACAACGGLLRAEGGRVRCIVCEAEGVCAVCAAATFGIRRGGAERVEEWARNVSGVPVARPTRARLPKRTGEVVIGGAESVRDLGPGNLDLVAILDADAAARRPGLAARERALAVWMEAVGWARPAGRAIVQSSHPADPAVQALVRGNPDRFLTRERDRRAAAGFPVGAPTFRVTGTRDMEAAIAEHEPITTLVTTRAGRTVCLLVLAPERLQVFGRAMRALAAEGVVERVEAEPHL
jgi:primosomal protein N' (replication factor Y) (superfamily II helicase)